MVVKLDDNKRCPRIFFLLDSLLLHLFWLSLFYYACINASSAHIYLRGLGLLEVGSTHGALLGFCFMSSFRCFIFALL